MSYLEALTEAGRSRNAVARVVEVARQHAAQVDDDATVPRAALEAMRSAGLLGAMVPRGLGGAGLLPSFIAAVVGQVGTGCSSSGMVLAMHSIQVACLVGHAHASPWHRSFLARVASDGLLLASVTSEAGLGGRMRTSKCALESLESGYVRISKDATSVSYGADADAYLLTARREPSAPGGDQVMVVVERPQCTLEPRGSWDALGMRGTGTQPFLISATVAPEQVLPVPFGEVAATHMVPASHLLWASLWLSIAGDAVDRARAFLRAGAQRGRPQPASAGRLATAVATLQALQARTRGMLAAYDARFALAAANEPVAEPPPGEIAELNALKIAASEGAVEAALQALTVLGFAGYQNGSPYSVGRHVRDLLSAPLMIANDAIREATVCMLLGRSPTLGHGEF